MNKNTNVNKIDEKTVKPNIINQSVDFESSLMHKIKRSEKIAWTVAGCALLVCIALAVGYIKVMPLKEKIPYLVVTNPSSGVTTLSKIIGSYNIEEINSNEALAKSHVAKFLNARESYDYDSIARLDWLTVFSMTVSSKNILKFYEDLFKPTNPNNLGKLYGKDRSVRVKIKSIILTNDPNPKNGYTIATIRFDKLVVNKNYDKVEDVSSHIATMSFTYSNFEMQEELQILNPMGFMVTAYKVDSELNTSKADLLKQYNERVN